MRESAVETAVVAWAKKQGWLVRKVSWIGQRGAPDRLFGKAGRLVLIEFKAPGRKPTPQQMREHDRLRAAGFEVHVCDDYLKGVAALSRATPITTVLTDLL